MKREMVLSQIGCLNSRQFRMLQDKLTDMEIADRYALLFRQLQLETEIGFEYELDDE
jgi:hypothetical protein